MGLRTGARAGRLVSRWSVEIDPLIADWVHDVNQLLSQSGTPLPERLAQVHNAFQRIHPFLDGNGRAGRLLLNLILVRMGYPPAIVFKHERSRYLDAMRKADAGDFGPMGELSSSASSGRSRAC